MQYFLVFTTVRSKSERFLWTMLTSTLPLFSSSFFFLISWFKDFMLEGTFIDTRSRAFYCMKIQLFNLFLREMIITFIREINKPWHGDFPPYMAFNRHMTLDVSFIHDVGNFLPVYKRICRVKTFPLFSIFLPLKSYSEKFRSYIYSNHTDLCMRFEFLNMKHK